jgi:hypothetical protein
MDKFQAIFRRFCSSGQKIKRYRRIMKKQLLLTSVFLVISLIAISECLPRPPIEDEWMHTHCIFIGTVISNIDHTIYNRYGEHVSFNNIVVNKVFKGSVAEGDTITMFRRTIENYKFQENKQYVIFAFNNCGFLSTNVCQRTCPIEEAGAILKFLESKPIEIDNTIEYEIIQVHETIPLTAPQLTP